VEAVFGIKVPTILPVGIDITGAFQSGDNGYFRLAPKVTYAADKLSAYVQGDININIGEEGATPGTNYSNFGVTDWEKVLDNPASIGFEIGAGYQLTDLIGLYAAIGSANLSYLDGNGLYIKPGATFGFGPNTSIEIFDKISNIGADSDYLKFANQFQIDFVWSF
jgi:hypothetical protein